MSDFKELLTKDGSVSLRSLSFQENFHSFEGAFKETEVKFIKILYKSLPENIKNKMKSKFNEVVYQKKEEKSEVRTMFK